MVRQSGLRFAAWATLPTCVTLFNAVPNAFLVNASAFQFALMVTATASLALIV